MAFDVFYDCQRCTACCRWPGQVKIGEVEIEAMARLFGMSGFDFVQEYTRIRPQRDGLALKDKANGECIFLEDGGCRVQAAKPVQCQGFPNTWSFPGWRNVCEAVPRLVPASARSAAGVGLAGSKEGGL
jgi:hypothetical protein